MKRIYSLAIMLLLDYSNAFDPCGPNPWYNDNGWACDTRYYLCNGVSPYSDYEKRDLSSRWSKMPPIPDNTLDPVLDIVRKDIDYIITVG